MQKLWQECRKAFLTFYPQGCLQDNWSLAPGNLNGLGHQSAALLSCCSQLPRGKVRDWEKCFRSGRHNSAVYTLFNYV